jgi:hypothetical protein
LEAGLAARSRGHYTRREFLDICRWKSGRTQRRAEANSEVAVKETTRLVFERTDESIRVGALCSLEGVGVPTASALLFFAFPDDYPILDRRTLESLGVRARTHYSQAFWLEYLAACRRLARKHGVHIRVLDKALWEHSKERTRGRRARHGPAAGGKISPLHATPTALLLGCVKTKPKHAAKARDLYGSPLWFGRRSYAEASGRPWLILSAKYRLVEPDRVLRRYNLALSDLPAAARRLWGKRVVSELEARFGSLKGATFEVHAGAAYRDAITAPLAQRGAQLTVPFTGLTLGEQVRWYAQRAKSARRRLSTNAEVGRAMRDLDGAPKRIAARDWPDGLRDLNQAGMYSWWVDAAGARDLSDGLRQRVRPGRIYAGQTGATKWPSGKPGRATLASRIGGNHLRGRISASTFRLTLAAALADSLGLVSEASDLDTASEHRLSGWMREHLEVGVHRFPDRDALADLEDHVLAKLDPPLNLDGMPPTPIRQSLSGQRRALFARPPVGGTVAEGAAAVWTGAQGATQVAAVRSAGVPCERVR